MAYGQSVWRTVKEHPVLGAAAGFLIGRKAFSGSLWAQLLMLGGLANWSDDKKKANQKAQVQKLIEDSKIAADAAVAEVDAKAKTAIEPGGNIAVAFANETQTARNLALEHPKLWEYLLVEELLKSKLQALRNQYDDFERTLTSAPKRACSAAEFVKWVTYKSGMLAETVSSISSSIQTDLIDAVGKPGVSGDAIKILAAMDRFFAHCQSFLAFELDLFGMDPPANMMVLRDDFRGISSWVIDSVERFTGDWSRAIEEVRKGSHEIKPVTLKLVPPPKILKAKTDMEKIKNHPEEYV
jgi:hypothetical protein